MIYLIGFILPPIGALFAGRILWALVSLILIIVSMGWLWPLMSIITLFVIAQAQSTRRHNRMMSEISRHR